VASIREHHLAAFEASPTGLPRVRLSNGHLGISKQRRFGALPPILMDGRASPVPRIPLLLSRRGRTAGVIAINRYRQVVYHILISWRGCGGCRPSSTWRPLPLVP
jgi:hypothetical protein